MERFVKAGCEVVRLCGWWMVVMLVGCEYEQGWVWCVVFGKGWSRGFFRFGCVCTCSMSNARNCGGHATRWDRDGVVGLWGCGVGWVCMCVKVDVALGCMVT